MKWWVTLHLKQTGSMKPQTAFKREMAQVQVIDHRQNSLSLLSVQPPLLMLYCTVLAYSTAA